MSYSKNSVYANTPYDADSNYLDQLVSRNVPARSDDPAYEIDLKYHLRPDLLAWDLYNDSGLWWVFAERNPNTLVDPLGDFVAGTIIYLPEKSALINALGL